MVTGDSSRPRILRVGLDARLVSGHPGGVQQVIIGLAHGLSRLESETEEYHFLVDPDRSAWLMPYIGGPCRMLPVRSAPRGKTAVKRYVPFATPATRAVRRLTGLAGRRVPTERAVPVSDGTIERAGIQVMHFPKQDAFLTGIPSIFHPHDIQHVHFPEFFSREDYRLRELCYAAFCRQAAMVTVTSTWNRDDIAAHYGLPPEKFSVIHLAPALAAYASPSAGEIEAVRQKYGLPDKFILYPAQTWPHKNHLRLIEALHAIRRERGVTIPLVCTSTRNDFYKTIAKSIRELHLEKSVVFTGFVEPVELRAIYERAHSVVVPSLFEAAGGFGPIAEAFLNERPVACSNVTSLPDEVGDAALLFDPMSVAQIAACIWRLWTDRQLCGTLVRKGRAKVRRYDWTKTAKIFRAHYRRLAGFPLTDEDRELLALPPLY
ncbi:MAG: hypothetical protein Kow00122_15710 [Thermoleophilia bacterium]